MKFRKDNGKPVPVADEIDPIPRIVRNPVDAARRPMSARLETSACMLPNKVSASTVLRVLTLAQAASRSTTFRIAIMRDLLSLPQLSREAFPALM